MTYDLISTDVQKQPAGAPNLSDSLHQPIGFPSAATAGNVMASALSGAQTSNAQNVLHSQSGMGNDPLTHYLSRLSRQQLLEIMSEMKVIPYLSSLYFIYFYAQNNVMFF